MSSNKNQRFVLRVNLSLEKDDKVLKNVISDPIDSFISSQGSVIRLEVRHDVQGDLELNKNPDDRFIVESEPDFTKLASQISHSIRVELDARTRFFISELAAKVADKKLRSASNEK